MKYRKELVVACLIAAFAAGVAYDTQFVIELEGVRAAVGAFVVACFAAILFLATYPKHLIQPALLAAWPLHLFTIFFGGVTIYFHGREQLGTFAAYTIVAYATYLLLPLCFIADRRLFDTFAKIVAIASALLAIPSYVGAMGIDSLVGIPLRNKPTYSQFSGLIASGGIFEHAEGHALQMALGLFCCLYLFRKTRSLLYAICLVMVLAGLVVSQGRGAIFGVVIAGAYFVLPELFRRSRPLFVGSLMFFLLFPFAIWPQLAEIPGVAGYLRLERGLSGRDVAWQYAISLVEEQPMTGHGFGSSADLSEAARKHLRRGGYSGAGTTFHNTFITKAVELGVVVTSIYALLYLIPVLRICRPSRFAYEQELLRSLIVVITTASLFRDYNIGGIRSTAIMVAVFLGVANLWHLVENWESFSEKRADIEPSSDANMPVSSVVTGWD